MADLLVVSFPTETRAEEVRARLLAMQKEYLIELGDAVVAVKRADGTVKLNQLVSPTAAGAASGAIWGTLIGMIFLMPLVGTAVGAASGALSGKLTDVGINDAFMKDVASSLHSGEAALFLLIRKVTADKVLADVARARAIGAEVVIIRLHVCVEMQTGPTADDRALVNTIARGEAKPELVIIHGPHVPQNVERVNGITTYWSLGNYISGMGVSGRGKYSDPRTLDGLMALVRFTEQPNGSWLVEPWTALLCNALGSRIVYPGITTLATPGISSTLRSQMQACLTRTSAVVSLLK